MGARAGRRPLAELGRHAADPRPIGPAPDPRRGPSPDPGAPPGTAAPGARRRPQSRRLQAPEGPPGGHVLPAQVLGRERPAR